MHSYLAARSLDSLRRIGHDAADMLVSLIFAGFAGNTPQRRRAEAQLIFRHETMHPKGMNVDFAFV